MKERYKIKSFELRKNLIIANLTDLEARKNEVLAGLELRALETEKDFQKAYDKINAQWKEQFDLEETLRNSMKSKIAKMQNELDDQIAEAKNKAAKLFKEKQKIWFDAKNKGFDLKERSAELDFETRALETEKDYQREYDALMELIHKEQKAARESKEEWLIFKAQEEKHLKYAANYIKESNELVAEAKKKGFKLKRSEETDFEVRFLKTQKDYQQEIDDWAEQVEDRLEKVKFAEEDAKYWKEEAKADAKSMEKVYKEGTAKGFKLKMKTYKF